MSILIVLAVAYFTPAIVAACRSHHNGVAIFMLNLLAGWTFVGWVAAAVWACTSRPAVRLVPVVPVPAQALPPQTVRALGLGAVAAALPAPQAPVRQRWASPLARTADARQ